jgi:hypothetical protein
MSDLSPEDEALLERARSSGLPTADDHSRVKRKIAAQVGIGVGAGISAISTTSGAGAGLSGAGATVGTSGVIAVVAKVSLAVALVGGAVGVGVVAVRGPGGDTRAQGTPAAKGTERVLPSSTAVEVPAPFEALPPATPPSAPSFAPSVSTTAVGSVPVSPPSPAPKHASALPTPPRATVEGEPAAEPITVPRVAESTYAGGSLSSPVTSTSLSTSAPALPSQPAPGGPASVQAEAELLRQADLARKAGDAPRALALLDEHSARFPGGVLVPEREAERVVVLCALGRTEEARAAASAFLRQWPRSPLTSRVRASCGGG